MNSKLLLFSISFFLFFACGQDKSASQAEKIETTNFDAQWKQINSLEQKGLQGTAIKELNQILNNAIEQKNYSAVFKALAIRSKFIHQIEEESEEKIIESFHQAIDDSGSPGKQLLQSALAELYEQYYQQNQWKINERSNLSDSSRKSILKMSGDELQNTATQLYLLSTQHPNNQNESPLSDYVDILNLAYQDSLYLDHFSLADFIANRALKHFEIQFNQAQLSEPILSSDKLFSNREAFIEHELSKECKQKELKNWIGILSDRLAAGEDEHSIAYFDLYRLQTLRSWSMNETANLLYEEALDGLIEDLEKADLRDRIRAEQARFKHIEYRDSKAAIEICKQCEDEGSIGSSLCKELVFEIKKKQHDIFTESVYPSNKPILFAYSYQNLKQVHFRLYKDEASINSEDRYDQDWLKDLLSSDSEKEWEQELKDWQDYRQHRTELKLNGLTNAPYILVASNRADFHPDSSYFSIAHFWVSDIAYFSRKNEINGNYQIHLKDRNSGKALEDVKLSLYRFEYHNTSRRNRWELVRTVKSNQEGIADIQIDNQQYGSFRFKFDYQDQQLISNNTTGIYSYNQRRKDRTSIQFFTDRKIYQPGQLVKFKAILSSASEYEEQVLPDQKREIKLIDPRGEEIGKLSLSSNSFGSISGTFGLPKNALNGNYRILDANGSISFRVEEYRRPSFEVVFNEDGRQYRIGDTINVLADLISYTGLPVNQAKVEYRIIQQELIPAPYPYAYSSYWPQPKKTLIENGSMKLEGNQFKLSFKADEANKRRNHLRYFIELNVTSPLGENISAEKSMNVHRLPYNLTSSVKDKLELEELNQLSFTASNNRGQKLKVKGQVELWSLNAPKKLSIDKYWADIDHQLLEKEDYENDFPFYDYNSKEELSKFSTSRLLSKQAFESGKALNSYKNLKPGAYLLKAYSITKEGDTVQFSNRFLLYDSDSKVLPYPLTFWSHIKDDSLFQGEPIELLIGSGFSDLEIVAELVFQDHIIQKKVKIDNEQKKISFDSRGTEGMIMIHLSGMKAGRHIIESIQLEVHPKKKPFEIYLSSKRDFTQPGSREKWSISVKRLDKNEKLEVLASMYDKSLDQLEDQSWTPYSSLFFSQKVFWTKGIGSHLGQNRRFQPPNRNRHSNIPTAPSLNWFGFRLGWAYYGRQIALSEASIANGEVGEDANTLSTVEIAKEESNMKVAAQEEKDPIRKDFSETVFFEPHLKLSNSNDASFSFIMPDALTTYKFRALAHNKGLEFSQITHEVISKKELMVSSYLPRFFRTGDKGTLKVKVQNASDKNQEGMLSLRFYDAQSGRAVDILEIGADQSFALVPEQEVISSFQFEIPKKVGLLKYEIAAKGSQHSDIEVGYIQVLPTTLLLAESFPFEVQAGQSRELLYNQFAKKVDNVPENRLFKVEYSMDPRWMAVYALPAMLSDRDDCPEAVFSNLYTRALGSFTANKIEGLEDFVSKLKQQDSPPSQFEINKDVNLTDFESTPWLKVGREEALQRSGLKGLFETDQIDRRLSNDLNLLEQLQLPNGAWPWFKGMSANRYLSQYILGGLEKLDQLQIIKDQNDIARLERIKTNVKRYLDAELKRDFDRILANKIDEEVDYLSPSHIHFLYSRSFDKKWQQKGAESFFMEEARAHWQSKNPMLRALIGLTFFNTSPNDPLVKEIAASLKDIAISDSLGVHWKFNGNRPYWYNSAIESQAYMIEYFQALSLKDPDIEGMKKWLLHQKKQQYWPGSKASMQACYALLAEDKPLSYETKNSDVLVGGQPLNYDQFNMPALLSKSWEANEISSDLATIKVKQSKQNFGWGAAHWQYYEESDKVKSHSKEGLSIRSNYYTYDPKTKELKAVDNKIEVGELIKHRLIIEVDYDMEYVYINDQPPACLQAAETRSGMHYSDGLSYYANVKATERDWFIERLNRGTYVLEIDYRVSHSGTFTGGVSRLQCMYAPEFVAYDNAGSLEIAKP